MPRFRFTCLSATLMIAAAILILAAVPAFSQSAPYKAPRTSWGDPDIQGQWPAAQNIPMQRPANIDRTTLSEEEYNRRVQQARQQDEADNQEFAPNNAGVSINPPGYWIERTKPNMQAAMVVDPADGRIPPLTPEARDFVQSMRGGLGPGQHFPSKVDSPEDFDIYSRCITRGLVSSMLPTLYNFGNHIVQGPGYVVIRNEMIHENRVIPLDGRPHVGAAIQSYMGDSRGHWEGETLVVETTNLNNKTGTGGGYFSDLAKLIERFTRTGPKELKYELTVSDPKTWTRPWTINYPYLMDDEYPVIEYACHEGNYMMAESLKAARMKDAEGKSTKVDSDNFVRPAAR